MKLCLSQKVYEIRKIYEIKRVYEMRLCEIRWSYKIKRLYEIRWYMRSGYIRSESCRSKSFINFFLIFTQGTSRV